MSDSGTHIMIDSLQHYYERLAKLAEQHLPYIISIKITSELAKVKGILERIKTNGIDHRLENEIRFLDIPENRHTLCLALKCYLNDLQKSSVDIDNDLGNISLARDAVKDEIELIRRALKDICGVLSDNANSVSVR